MNMSFKCILPFCLGAFLNLATAQEEMLPIDLIELLGEFDEEETEALDEAMSEMEMPNSVVSKQIKDLGAQQDENT